VHQGGRGGHDPIPGGTPFGGDHMSKFTDFGVDNP
jgi:hypothetical protein